jgi:hypothetical protein
MTAKAAWTGGENCLSTRAEHKSLTKQKSREQRWLERKERPSTARQRLGVLLPTCDQWIRGVGRNMGVTGREKKKRRRSRWK